MSVTISDTKITATVVEEAIAVTIAATIATGGGGGGAAVWGGITGTLANQTDLQSALNAKETPAGAQAKADAAQAFAIQRANHTGTQAPATIVQDSSNRFVTDAEKSAWNAKQDALANASTLAKITEAAGLPLWDGGAWPGGGGGSVAWGGITGTLSNQTDLQNALNAKETPAGAQAKADAAQAYAIQRANHTGSQAISTVTGLQTALDDAEDRRKWTYHGVVETPTLTDNGNGTITVGSNGVIQVHPDISGDENVFRYALAASSPLSMVDGTLTYIIADSAGYSATTSTAFFSDLRKCVVAQVYRAGTFLHILSYGDFANDLAEKLLIRSIQTARFEKITGLALGEVATRRVTVGSGAVYFGVNIVALSASDSSTDFTQLWYRVGGVWTAQTVTQYDNTQYDDGTNLQTLNNNQYGVIWVYRGVEANNHTYLLLGNASYTLAQAQASQPDGLPVAVSSHALLVGRIIVQKNASIATEIDQVSSVALTGTPATNHNDLLNIQGGAAGDYQHLTTAQVAAMETTTGAQAKADAAQAAAIAASQPVDSDLTAVAGLSTTGLIARTGSGTATTRTVTGTSNQVSVSNGDGVAGNPTLSLPQDIHTGATPTFAGEVLDAGSGSLPSPVATRQLALAASDSTAPVVESFAWGAASSQTIGRHASGTRASPTATADGNTFHRVDSIGHDGTSYVATSRATSFVKADGTWSGSNTGTYFSWEGTPNASTTRAEWMRLWRGNLGIGTAAPGQKLTVAGTIESTSGGFKFPDGTTQTTAATGGSSETVLIESDWMLNNNNSIAGMVGAAVSSGTMAVINSTADHPGIVALRDSTTANGGYTFFTANAAHLISAGQYCRFIFSPQGVRAGQIVRLGWQSSVLSTDPANGSWAEITANGSTTIISAKCRAASVSTTHGTTYTLTSGNWYNLKITCVAGPNVQYQLYTDAGSLVWDVTISTNVPSAVLGWGINAFETSTDAGADIIWMDYHKLAVTRTLTR